MGLSENIPEYAKYEKYKNRGIEVLLLQRLFGFKGAVFLYNKGFIITERTLPKICFQQRTDTLEYAKSDTALDKKCQKYHEND